MMQTEHPFVFRAWHWPDLGHFGCSDHNESSQMMLLDTFSLASCMCLSETKSQVNLKASLDV